MSATVVSYGRGSLPSCSSLPLCKPLEILILPFLEYHIVRIIQYVAFLDWLFLLSNIQVSSMSFHGLIAHFVSDQISRSVVSYSLWPHESQHARPPCPSPTPGVHSDSRHWVNDAIQLSHPLSSPSPPAPNPSQRPSFFQWVNSSHEVAKVLEFQL